MSRAFGNRMLKQFVVAEPDIQEQELSEEFELLVLASDGLWDVVSNDDVISIAQAELEPEAAANKLIETAFGCGSADNITCIVVKLCQNSPTESKPPSLTTTETETQHQIETEIEAQRQTETETEFHFVHGWPMYFPLCTRLPNYTFRFVHGCPIVEDDDDDVAFLMTWNATWNAMSSKLVIHVQN